MKKGVLLLIAVVFVISIVVVAFFGVSAQNISPVVYITSVEILDMDGNEIPTNAYGLKTITLNFERDDDLYDSEEDVYYMQYFFTTRIQPDNATYENFIYYCNITDGTLTCTYPSGGGFLIKEYAEDYLIATITCRSNDGGPTVYDTVYLIVIY